MYVKTTNIEEATLWWRYLGKPFKDV